MMGSEAEHRPGSLPKHSVLRVLLLVALALGIGAVSWQALYRNLVFVKITSSLLNGSRFPELTAYISGIESLDPRINYSRGLVFLMSGQPGPAAEALEKAVGKGGVADSLTLVELGYAYYEDRQYDRALATWLRSDVAPIMSGRLAHQGTQELLSGLLEDGTRALVLSIAMDPVNPTAYYRVAYGFWAVGDRTRAKSYLYQGLGLDRSSSVERAFALGRYLVLIGDFERAAVELGRVVDARPADVWARLHLAEALEASGRIIGACEEYSVVVTLAPDLSIAWAQLARAQATLGQRPAAIQSYRRALELEPANSAWESELERLIYP